MSYDYSITVLLFSATPTTDIMTQAKLLDNLDSALLSHKTPQAILEVPNDQSNNDQFDNTTASADEPLTPTNHATPTTNDIKLNRIETQANTTTTIDQV